LPKQTTDVNSTGKNNDLQHNKKHVITVHTLLIKDVWLQTASFVTLNAGKWGLAWGQYEAAIGKK